MERQLIHKKSFQVLLFSVEIKAENLANNFATMQRSHPPNFVSVQGCIINEHGGPMPSRRNPKCKHTNTLLKDL